MNVTDTRSAVVDYSAPVVSGEAQPVVAACTIASGTSFEAGTTDIICTATDALTRTAQCAFSVTVTVVPRLRGTKIVAFGDSITAGVVSDPIDDVPPPLDPERDYPSVLRRWLQQTYLTQDVLVVNSGCSGERVLSGTPGCPEPGEDRLEVVVLQHRPDVLIVLEGVNGLLTTADAKQIAEGLRRGVRRAISDGVKLVIVSTILPGLREGAKPPPEEPVRALNDEIRWWAPIEGARLADAWQIFDADRRTLIGRDGLHPTLAGYQRLGEFFFHHIKNGFELPPPAAAPSLLAARP